jgi:ornithine carbamoyltransferase
MRHLLTLQDWSAADIQGVLDLARKIKKNPENYENAMFRKVLVMLFEKPSLRTRVSFEVAAAQMGGHAIYYDISTSPMGAGKESVHDTAKTLSRYANILMARLYEHSVIEELAHHSSIPVINGLTNFSHPGQIMADLLTVQEHQGKLAGLTLAYLGDANNNVTHSLMFACPKMGMNLRVGCPAGHEYSPQPSVAAAAAADARQQGVDFRVVHDAGEAVRGADVVYCDSWMSYHIAKDQLQKRINIFTPYQVNAQLMAQAAPGAIFMNCLPAQRGYEQTAEVIDGPQSVVFDEAENRLHIHKALLLILLG